MLTRAIQLTLPLAIRMIGAILIKGLRNQSSKGLVKLARSKQPVNLTQCHQTTDCKFCSALADRIRVQRNCKDLSDIKQFCKLSCCNSCTYCKRAATKERHKSGFCKTTSMIKYVNNVSCVDHLSFVKHVPNIQAVVQDLTVGARLHRWSVHSTHGVYGTGKGGQSNCITKGYKNMYIYDWLVRARSHQTCRRHTQTLVAICQDLGWLVNMEKSELNSKEVFNFSGYQLNLKEGKVGTTLEQ